MFSYFRLYFIADHQHPGDNTSTKRGADERYVREIFFFRKLTIVDEFSHVLFLFLLTKKMIQKHMSQLLNGHFRFLQNFVIGTNFVILNNSRAEYEASSLS